ncbi:MAG TPA: DUF3168 domain-containing protein [Allosphingosinicella sp.]|nr:DUF3168 domain-containing protein [Allosphingosinicella sp.]
MNASGALIAAAIAALRDVPGLTGVHEESPFRAAIPSATVAAGLETDWSHKSGAGRELRLSILLRDEGESPAQLRALCGAVQAVLDGLETADGWSLVTLIFVRSMIAAQAPGKWSAAIDYRARMLRED